MITTVHKSLASLIGKFQNHGIAPRTAVGDHSACRGNADHIRRLTVPATVKDELEECVF